MVFTRPLRGAVKAALPSAGPVSLALGLGLLLAACGGSAPAPAGSPPTSSAAAPASAAAKPAASASRASSAAAKPAASVGATPEKPNLQVGLSGTGATQLPLFIAQDAGYFKDHGLNVTINTMAASVANQALVAGSLDVYSGAASMITAHLAGADSIYVAAPSDHPQIILFGQKGLTSLADLRGKTVAVTSPGTTKDIFIRHSAAQLGLTVDKDIRLLYNSSDTAAMATFTAGNADALLVSPPETTRMLNEGYPVLVDYPKEGIKVIEPGVAVSRSFFQKNPNTLKAYLMAYLDATKRAFEDIPYGKQIDAKVTKTSDPKIVDQDYELGLKMWNKNLIVDPADIQLVLDALTDPKAKTAQPADFYDNSLISQVNRDYGVKLFPGDIKP